MIIKRLTEIDEPTIHALGRLIQQLTGSKKVPLGEELEKVIESDDTYLFVATEKEEIIGTLTLVFYRIPSGLKVWIEDVIVSESHQGKGVATALIWHALEVARSKGARKADLTSSPSREAANKLYRKMGFDRRETNMYRLVLLEDK